MTCCRFHSDSLKNFEQFFIWKFDIFYHWFLEQKVYQDICFPNCLVSFFMWPNNVSSFCQFANICFVLTPRFTWQRWNMLTECLIERMLIVVWDSAQIKLCAVRYSAASSWALSMTALSQVKHFLGQRWLKQSFVYEMDYSVVKLISYR